MSAFAALLWMVGCGPTYKNAPSPEFLIRGKDMRATQRPLRQPEIRKISSFAIPLPRVRLLLRRGNTLADAPADRQSNAAFYLIHSLVRAHPENIFPTAPLPDHLGEEVAKSLCHRDSLLATADLMKSSKEYRARFQAQDPLRFVLEPEAPLCELAPHQGVDALVLSHLYGFEGQWKKDAMVTAAAIGLAVAAAAAGVIVIPLVIPEQGLVLETVLVDNRTHRILAFSREKSSLAASEDNLDEMAKEAFDCFAGLSGKSPKPNGDKNRMGCYSFSRYEFETK
ncbi:MAG: hypothetical protein AB1405_10635 [Bdellovibrionota bacterium]